MHQLSHHINPLKEGEKIKISIGGAHKAAAASSSSNSKAEDGTSGTNKPTKSGGFLLKPPPPPGSTVFINLPPSVASTPAVTTDRLSLNANDLSAVNPPLVAAPAIAAPVQDFSGGDDDDWGDFSSST